MLEKYVANQIIALLILAKKIPMCYNGSMINLKNAIKFDNYPHDLDNFRLKAAENHFLVRAITDNSMMDLQQFVVLREARRRIIGNAVMIQEQQAETMLGAVEYARLLALNKTSRADFMDEISQHMAMLGNARNIFDMAGISVSVGCLICFALRSLGISFDLKETDMIYEAIPHEISEIERIFNEE